MTTRLDKTYAGKKQINELLSYYQNPIASDVGFVTCSFSSMVSHGSSIMNDDIVRPGEDAKKSKQNKRDEPDDAPADDPSNKRARTDFGPSGFLSLKRNPSGLMSGVSGASASAGAGRGVRPSKHAKHLTT